MWREVFGLYVEERHLLQDPFDRVAALSVFKFFNLLFEASRCASRARYPVFVISVVFSSMIGNVSSTNDVRSRSGKLVATG